MGNYRVKFKYMESRSSGCLHAKLRKVPSWGSPSPMGIHRWTTQWYIALLQGGCFVVQHGLEISHASLYPLPWLMPDTCNLYSLRWPPCLERETQGTMEERTVVTWSLKWSGKWVSETEKLLIWEKQMFICPTCSTSLLKIPDNIYYFARQCTCSYLELALNDINFSPLGLSSFSLSFFLCF